MTLTQYSDFAFEVFTIDDVFTDNELHDLYNHVDFLVNEKPRNFTTSDFVNGKVVHPCISNMLYSKISAHLPQSYTDRNGRTWQYEGAADTVMFAVVDKNKHFGIHTDTGCVHDIANNLYSKYTVLLYLNDDYEGGCTSFYSDTFDENFKVLPKKGRILCFDIDLFHRGEPVLSGSKRWIGTELVLKKSEGNKS